MEMKEKYWTSLCKMAEAYQADGEGDGHWPPSYHNFTPSGVCVMIFKGTEDDCKAIQEYLNQRPFDDKEPSQYDDLF